MIKRCKTSSCIERPGGSFTFTLSYLPSQSSVEKYRSIMDMNMHSGEKPFKCKQCNNTFSDAGSLTNHMRSHSNEKPFKCNHWNYASSNVGHLKSHSNETQQCEALQMLSVWAFIHRCRRSEEAHNDTQWREALQMNANSAIMPHHRQEIWRFIRRPIVEKNRTNVPFVTMQRLGHTILRITIRCTLVIILTNAGNSLEGAREDTWRRET